MAGNKDIGLLLFNSVSSPFLNIGITLAILSLSENIPVLKTWVVIKVSALLDHILLPLCVL